MTMNYQEWYDFVNEGHILFDPFSRISFTSFFPVSRMIGRCSQSRGCFTIDARITTGSLISSDTICINWYDTPCPKDPSSNRDPFLWANYDEMLVVKFLPGSPFLGMIFPEDPFRSSEFYFGWTTDFYQKCILRMEMEEL